MFSIVIVNWNGEKFLEGFLNSLMKQTYKEFRVFFVDNGSIDNSLSIVDKYSKCIDITIIKLEENLGFAEANNIGIEDALKKNTSNYIITLNNDMELDTNCLENIKRTVSISNRNDIFQILIMNYYDREIIDAAGIRFNRILLASQIKHGEKIENLDVKNINLQGVCAGAAVFPKSALNKMKEQYGYYFDPVFFAYYEDVDLSLNLKKMNYNFVLIKNAIVYHHHSGTGIQNSPFKTYFLTKNLFLYSKKYLSNKYKYKVLRMIYLLMTLAKSLKFILKGDIKNFFAVFKALKDIK